MPSAIRDKLCPRRIQFRCRAFSPLAAFRLERETEPIRFPRRSVKALLASLALHPEPQARKHLGALIWGHSPDRHARDSLRRVLKAVRKTLDDKLILTACESVQLNPAYPLRVDSNEFGNENSARRIALYCGGLLADLSLRVLRSRAAPSK